MIRYSLRCNNGHDFDGWYRSSDAFDTMLAGGYVTCSFCGSSDVEKALMAPSVAQAKPIEDKPAATQEQAMRDALDKLRQSVEANSDYVGLSFAEEARAMHEGRSPSRAIYGEAHPDDARQLIDDGVPVAPLPFIPRQKTN